MPDAQLVSLAAEEITRLGFVTPSEITGGHVVKQPHAYPVYDKDYPQNIGLIERYLNRIPNLYSIGRNGMHRYYNMDQAMMTGIAAARRICTESRTVSRSDGRMAPCSLLKAISCD
jgi:protoporphyrinogen oxidase